MIEDHFTGKDKFNLNKEGYRIAFNFENRNGKTLNDPRYLKWLVRMRQRKQGGESYQKIFDFHECTNDEMQDFYPVSKNSKELLDLINESDERSFYCLDWTDELEVYGDWS